mmetsp:Transcript_2804/g.4190  ORF Transcript_2804/g.4190 Transcript_2804/m.4190 type:complete len:465 (-) Transcript_2804:3-1397(-)
MARLSSFNVKSSVPPECTGVAAKALRIYSERIKELKELTGKSNVSAQALKDVKHLVPPKQHGELKDIPIGCCFDIKGEAAMVGIHSNPLGGIDAVKGKPCYAVCLSGKYNDIVLENGTIIYSGSGGRDASGRQCKDQSIAKKENTSLLRSKLTQTPIRVLSKVFQSTSKWHFQYNGLYICTSHVFESSKDGPKVHNFTLEPVIGKSMLLRARHIDLNVNTKRKATMLVTQEKQPRKKVACFSHMVDGCAKPKLETDFAQRKQFQASGKPSQVNECPIAAKQHVARKSKCRSQVIYFDDSNNEPNKKQRTFFGSTLTNRLVKRNQNLSHRASLKSSLSVKKASDDSFLPFPQENADNQKPKLANVDSTNTHKRYPIGPTNTAAKSAKKFKLNSFVHGKGIANIDNVLNADKKVLKNAVPTAALPKNEKTKKLTEAKLESKSNTPRICHCIEHQSKPKKENTRNFV